MQAEEIRVLEVESLDLEAHGVARSDGKVVFVRDALPGERVRARTLRRKPRFDTAQTVEVLRASALRTTPACPHYGVCGGCSMQHLDARAQLAIKQRSLEDQLLHLGKVKPRNVLRPMSGSSWGYRYRARLSVRHVAKKGGVLVGFHERGSSFVADMHECLVLPPRVSRLLPALRAVIGALKMRDRMPQIEVAIGRRCDSEGGAPGDAQGTVDSGGSGGSGSGEEVLALVFRVLDAVDPADHAALVEFAAAHRFELWFQPRGPESIELVAGGRDGRSRLAYSLPEFGVTMPFRPTDFTQVNHRINEVLVSRALRLLEPRPTDRVADLFCGLGNFSLPLATRAASVLGIEGSRVLVERAGEAARLNRLQDRARFREANLFETDLPAWQSLGRFDRVLIDPPRDGALEISKSLAGDEHKPARVVYVSCNPATLARDAGVLVNTGGFELLAAGAVDMFPHTSHVESIAVFAPRA